MNNGDIAPQTFGFDIEIQYSCYLLRLLIANHPFVDANKRTALNTTTVFYFLNGYRFTYDDDIRSLLKQFATDETSVDDTETIEYFRTYTEVIHPAGEVEAWREDLLQYGVDVLTDDSSGLND